MIEAFLNFTLFAILIMSIWGIYYCMRHAINQEEAIGKIIAIAGILFILLPYMYLGMWVYNLLNKPVINNTGLTSEEQYMQEVLDEKIAKNKLEEEKRQKIRKMLDFYNKHTPEEGQF